MRRGEVDCANTIFLVQFLAETKKFFYLFNVRLHGLINRNDEILMNLIIREKFESSLYRDFNTKNLILKQLNFLYLRICNTNQIIEQFYEFNDMFFDFILYFLA